MHVRGQSETVGVVLLTAVIVIVTVLAGAFILADFQSSAEDDPEIAIESDVTAESIELRHRGGNSFDPSAITVVVRDDREERSYTLAADFDETTGTNETFGPGQRWRRDLLANNERLYGTVKILIVDEDSNELLYESTTEVGTDGLVLELDDGRIATDDSTNYTVTELFEGGTSREFTDEATVSAANTTVATVDEDTTEVIGNNTGTTTLTAKLPDRDVTATAELEVVEPGTLIATGIEHDNPVAANETLNVNATVRNVGALERTGNVSLVRIPFTTPTDLNDTIDKDKLPAGASVDATVTVAELAPNATTTVNFEPFEVTPEEAGAATFAIGVTTEDQSDVLVEEIETVDGVSVVIESVTLPDEPVVETEPLPVEVLVKNRGNEPAINEQVRLFVDGVQQDTQTISLNSDSQQTVDLEYLTDVGDPPTVNLTIETLNDTESRTARVDLGSANLTVESLEPVTAEPLPGKPLTMEVTVANDGIRPLASTESVNLSFDGEQVDSTTLDSLAVGDNQTVTLSGTVPSGLGGDTLDVTATVSNDTRSESIDILEPAYFDITSLDTNSPVRLGVFGSELVVTTTVQNVGDVTGQQQLQVDAFGGTFQDLSGPIELAPGESETVEFTFAVNAPYEGEVAVSSENDTETAIATVSDDLGVFDIRILDAGTDEEVVEGEPVNVTVGIGAIGIPVDAILSVTGPGIDAEVDRVESITEDDVITLTWENTTGMTGSFTATAIRDSPFLGDAEDQTQVTVEPPTFSVDDIAVRGEARPGDSLPVSANVSTNAPATDEQTAELRFGDNLTGERGTDYRVLENRTVTLGDRNTTQVDFEATIPDDAITGEHSIGVFTEDDGRTATITVTE